MKIVSSGMAIRAMENSNAQSCAFPSVCVLPDGRWIAGCRAAPAKVGLHEQHVVLSLSDDEGRTWSTPVAPFAPIEFRGKPSRFRGVYLTSLGGDAVLAALMWTDYSNPDLPFFNEETEGLLDTRIFLSRSHDGGETWSAPWLVDTAPYDVPTPVMGSVMVLKNGQWACPFETNKHYHESGPWHHFAVLMFSRDEGKTWPEYSIAGNDPDNRIFYWDQRPGLLTDGSILNLFWTYDNGDKKYLSIHARESRDNGRTWSEYWDTGVPDQPAPPVALRDGRIAMIYVDRTNTPAIRARLSEDGGRTWPAHSEDTLFQIGGESQTWDKGSMQDTWAEMGKFSLGLPQTTLLPNGDVLVVFYAGPRTDFTHIHWMRLRA